jgi:hypothetical protein
LPDICPHCSPESFEKFSNPSDQKIWMGFEANPNQYEKRYDSEGVFYIRKPEYRAQQENTLRAETEEERTNRERAEARKRAERRTEPMSVEEETAAMRKAALYAEMLQGGVDIIH